MTLGANHVEVPTAYRDLVAALPSLNLSFGSGGIKLFTVSEIQEGQIGYSVDRDGRSLCGNAPGDWRLLWLTIGYDTGLGDPILIDSSKPSLPVFTAIRGDGSWNPMQIAVSLEAFCKIFLEFARIAKGRESPTGAESNPLTVAEIESFLAHVTRQ